MVEENITDKKIEKREKTFDKSSEMQEAEDEMPSVETQDTKTKEENIISNIKVKTATLMTLEDIKGKINITQEEINRNTETINAVIQLETSRNHDECDFEVISNASVKNSLIKMLDSGRKSLQLPVQLPAGIHFLG